AQQWSARPFDPGAHHARRIEEECHRPAEVNEHRRTAHAAPPCLAYPDQRRFMSAVPARCRSEMTERMEHLSGFWTAETIHFCRNQLTTVTVRSGRPAVGCWCWIVSTVAGGHRSADDTAVNGGCGVCGSPPQYMHPSPTTSKPSAASMRHEGQRHCPS